MFSRIFTLDSLQFKFKKMNDAKQNRLLKAKIFYPNMTFTLKIFRNQSSTKIRQNSYLFYARNGIAGHTVFFRFWFCSVFSFKPSK